MIILKDTTSLELKLGGSVTSSQLPFYVAYVDSTSTNYTPSNTNGTSNNTTVLTLVSAPASSEIRTIKYISIDNSDSVDTQVILQINESSIIIKIVDFTLETGDRLEYTDTVGFRVLNSAGELKTGTGGGGMVYPGAGIPISTGSGWSTSITDNSTDWDTAYSWGNHASAGYLTSITSGQITTALGFTPVTNARTLTINGTTYDLSADRSWTVSGGISTLNTLTGATQTFATGTTGTDFTISSSGTTHTFNIPTASSSNRGVLSTTDWTTFNSKESALTFSTGLTRTSNTITSNISTGVSGGQTIIGGTASGNSLTLSSTSNATKGKLLFGTSAYDEVNNRLGIGTTTPTYSIDSTGDIRGSAIRFTGGSTDTLAPAAAGFTINASSGLVVTPGNTGGASSGFMIRAIRSGSSSQISLNTPSSTRFSLALGTSYINGSYTKLVAAPAIIENNAGDIIFSQDTGLSVDATGFTPTERFKFKSTGLLGIGVTSPNAFLSVKASTTTVPHINLTAGVAPSSPIDGDLWYDGTDLKFRQGGTTKTITLT